MRKLVFVFAFLLLSGCDFEVPGGMDEKFGDQHFKSAISTIELHKIRTGEYPDSLSDLEYLGDWDLIWINSVRYEKVDGGYNLFIERGWAGEPALELPMGYRVGLGLVDSNVTWLEGQ